MKPLTLEAFQLWARLESNEKVRIEQNYRWRWLVTCAARRLWRRYYKGV